LRRFVFGDSLNGMLSALGKLRNFALKKVRWRVSLSSATAARFHRNLYLFIMAGSYLLLHAGLMLIFYYRPGIVSDDTSDLISYLFLVPPQLACLWAGWLLARNTTGALRVRWFMLLTSFALFYFGFFLQLYYPRHWPTAPIFVLGFLGAALNLLAIANPSEEQHLIRVPYLDSLLALMICTLSVIVTYLPMHGRPLVHTVNYFWYLVGYAVFVAVASIVALFSMNSPHEYRFGTLVCIHACLTPFVLYILDIVVNLYLRWHGASPFDALVSLPELAFTVFAFLPDGQFPRPEQLIRRRYLVRSAMPIFLTLAVFGLSIWLMQVHLIAGLVCIGTAIVVSGLRIAITQSKYMETRDQLSEQMLYDPLTHVGNRHMFNLTLEKEWNRTNRGGGSFALLLFDIDHFKRVNDTWGHQHGDTCLIAIAQCVRQNLPRTTDSVARYGGEEFAVILSLTTTAGALLVGEKIRKAVAELQIPGHTGDAITISIGVVVYTPLEHMASLADLIESADRMLYKAKASGRNRVELATPPLG
jgi:diguanylate cyclase (GGDEF)-like protein